MYPRLFELPWSIPYLGSITVYTYGVLLAAAYLLGLKFAMVRAKARGLDAVRVRLYAETADTELSEDLWNDLAGHPHHDVLDPNRLRHLYEHDERPPADIARHSLTSERVVRNTLEAAGVVVASARPRRLTLPRDWFQTHYLDTPKTLRQVARETGHSDTTVRRLAIQHGIPTRLRDKPEKS